MPTEPTYPGVYVEETPSNVRSITSVPTSVAAFVGTFSKGPLNEAIQVSSMAGFERDYGGLHGDSDTSYAVQQFFRNGGQQAWIIRVANTTPGPVPQHLFQGCEKGKTGLFALEDVDLFNTLCIPEAANLTATDLRAVYTAAGDYVENRRAMLIVDIPVWVNRPDRMQSWLTENASLRRENAAVYFPLLNVRDPLDRGRLKSIPPSGTIAGLLARTDAASGVWKAPAGMDAGLQNVESLAYNMTDAEIGMLNPLGVNCLRSVPADGHVCWGARTLEGADGLASEWKYVPIRRTALFIEESLFRGTQWVMFEPNDEPLWAQIRLNIGNFLDRLFRGGAFQGSTSSEAYFVKCDGETTTQTDIENGIVNILVGFAPLEPAEFVIIKIRHVSDGPSA